MSMSIVNGYVCTSSCDVAKAKKGQDPHPNEGSQDPGKTGQQAGDRDHAVVFGGSLADPTTNPNAIKPVTDAEASASPAGSAKQLVDLLV